MFYIEYFYKNNLPTNHPPLHPVGIRMYLNKNMLYQFNYQTINSITIHHLIFSLGDLAVLSQGAIEAPTLTQVFFSKELNKNLLIKWALVVHKPFKSHPK